MTSTRSASQASSSRRSRGQVYPFESVCKVSLQKSIPAQICQLILYVIDDTRQVDGFVRELTFAKRLYDEELVREAELAAPRQPSQVRPSLTEFVHLQSQFPHKSVKLFFILG